MNNTVLRTEAQSATTHTWFLQMMNMRSFILRNWNRRGIRIRLRNLKIYTILRQSCDIILGKEKIICRRKHMIMITYSKQ